jgi:hypothetical protein
MTLAAIAFSEAEVFMKTSLLLSEVAKATSRCRESIAPSPATLRKVEARHLPSRSTCRELLPAQSGTFFASLSPLSITQPGERPGGKKRSAITGIPGRIGRRS